MMGFLTAPNLRRHHHEGPGGLIFIAKLITRLVAPIGKALTTSVFSKLMKEDKLERARKAQRDRPPGLRPLSPRHLGQFLSGNKPRLLPAVLFVSLFTPAAN